MKTLIMLGAACLMTIGLYGGQHNAPLIPPTFPPPQQSNPPLPIDQPPTVVHGTRRQPFRPDQAKKQADELARLAQSVPPDIDKLAQGQFPRDLVTRLKRIEKLSKQLRREVAR
jgi:hypothetical protein